MAFSLLRPLGWEHQAISPGAAARWWAAGTGRSWSPLAVGAVACIMGTGVGHTRQGSFTQWWMQDLRSTRRGGAPFSVCGTLVVVPLAKASHMV